MAIYFSHMNRSTGPSAVTKFTTSITQAHLCCLQVAGIFYHPVYSLNSTVKNLQNQLIVVTFDIYLINFSDSHEFKV